MSLSGASAPSEATGGHYTALRSLGLPNSFTRQFDFWDDRYEGRRLFSEVLGTFFLVLVAAGAGMVNARFGGDAVPAPSRDPCRAFMDICLFGKSYAPPRRDSCYRVT